MPYDYAVSFGRMTADPKPSKRHTASTNEWKVLHKTLMPQGQKCFCGCGRYAESLHHLVGRGQGGDDIRCNLVPLSGSGTTLCHGALTSSTRCYDMRRKEYVEPYAVRAGIRRNMVGEHIRYVTEKKGSDWLDFAYPPPKEWRRR